MHSFRVLVTGFGFLCLFVLGSNANPRSAERPYVDAAPRTSTARQLSPTAREAQADSGYVTSSLSSMLLVPDPNEPLKNRFISFRNPATGPTAIRVMIQSMHHVDPPYTGGEAIPFTQFEGQSLYVGAPTRYVESRSGGIPFHAATLQCEPYYHEWSTIGLLHVTGEAIVPSSTYEVRIVAGSCRGSEDDCVDVSLPLVVQTSRWGDVLHSQKSDADGQTDFNDISALVSKFRALPDSLDKTIVLLSGENSRGSIDPAPELDFTHISIVVDAFRGLPYPYKPGKCSNHSVRACITDEDCTSENGEPAGSCLLCGLVSGGACCHADGTCDIVPEFACEGPGDSFKGDGEPCSRCCGPDRSCKPLTNTEWLEVQLLWPNMDRRDVCVEGPHSPAFNCVAWTIDSISEWVWDEVDHDGDGLWQLEDFEDFFAEYQKSAIIYGANNSAVLHTAKPLSNHCASSKAGEWIRIRHDRNQIEGGYYGDLLATFIY